KFIPFVNLPIVASVLSSTCFITSFIAATTKSSNISTSSGSTTSSCMSMDVIFFVPSAFSVTTPPPPLSSNSIPATSSYTFIIILINHIFLYVYVRNFFFSILFRCYNATTNSSLKLHSRQFFLCFHHFLLHLLHLLHHISHITFHVNSSFNIYDTSFLLFIL